MADLATPNSISADTVFTVERGQLKAGNFRCKLTEVLEVDGKFVDTDKGEPSKALRFFFEAIDGDQAGQVITTLVGSRLKVGNKCFRLVESLGVDLAKGDKFRIGDVIGNVFDVVVINADDGGAMFDSAAPAKGGD